MKIYLVTYYEDIFGVFSTLKAAKKFAKTKGACDITEMRLDDVSGYTKYL